MAHTTKIEAYVSTQWKRWTAVSPTFRLFFLGIFFLGINNGIQVSTFNNYLYDIFHLDSTQRGLLEFPRELPGFALIFLTATLAFLPLNFWAVIVGIL
ncbi:MAG: hypothetical protein WCG27_11990, partial [Pseudomonadota bacterium]